MKKVFLTGASGRLGCSLIPHLVEKGYRVRALIHERPLPAIEGDRIEQVRGSLTDQHFLNETVKGVDVVCHLAALMPPTPDDDLFDANIRATYGLLQAIAAQQRKPRFVFASSDATYCTGWSLGPYHSPIDENTPQRPVLFYGITKVIGEHLCLSYQEAYKVPTVRLRFPTILSPREFIDLFTGAPYKDYLILEDQGKWNDASSVKVVLEEDGQPFVEHVVDVRDAAHGVLLAIEKDSAVNQVFNIAGPSPFTYAEVGPIVANRLGVEVARGRCRNLYSYELSIQRARAMLAYRPKFGILESLEDAFC